MLISSFLVQSFLNSMKSVKVLVLSSFSLSFTEPVITCHMSTVSRVTPPPRPSTWAYMSSLQGYPLPDLVPRVTCPQSARCHSPHPEYWSHGHILKGDTPPRHCTWILMSAVSRVTPKPIYMGSQSPGSTFSQTLHFGSQVHSPQGDSSLPEPVPGVTYPKSPGCPTSQAMALGSFVQVPG